MTPPSTNHLSPATTLAQHLGRALAIVWGASILLSGLGGNLRSATSSSDDLRTIHDHRTGKPVKEALGDGTVYEFRAKVPAVAFWKTEHILDGVWLESKDKRTLTWISTASAVNATSTSLCLAGALIGAIPYPCPPASTNGGGTNGGGGACSNPTATFPSSQPSDIHAGSLSAAATLVCQGGPLTLTSTWAGPGAQDTDLRHWDCPAGTGPAPSDDHADDPVTTTWEDGGAGGTFDPASGTSTASGLNATYTMAANNPPDTITFKAKYDDSGTQFDDSAVDSNTVDVKVLKATSVDASEGTNIGTTTAPTNVVSVADSGVVTMTAHWNHEATVTENDLPVPGWDFTGTGSDPVPAHPKIQRTISKTTPSKTDFIASAGTSAATNVLIVAKATLDVMTENHNVAGAALPANEKKTPGAFVPLNNDDDNYSATTTSFGEDKDDPAATAGENDLLKIVLKKIDPAALGGKYTLTIPANLKVWKNPDRTQRVESNTTQIPADNDTTLYVEGFQSGPDTLKLNWTNGVKTLSDCDRIKVNVFFWLGPLNVPGRSIHQYVAAQNQVLPTSKWLPPTTGGTIVSGGSGPSDVRILWGAGPVVEKAVYKVNDNYIWDLEVNVVEVKVAPPAYPFLDGLLHGIDPVVRNHVLYKYVKTFPSALRWQAPVTLNGPQNGRGITHMRVGFIQNLIAETLRGHYDTVHLTLKSSTEGAAFPLVDTDLAFRPWFDVDPPAVFFDPTPQHNSKIIKSEDPVKDGPPLTADRGEVVAAGDDVLDRIEWKSDFQLDVCANTRDAINMADRVFTRRASIKWKLIGDGTIEQKGPSYHYTKAANAKIEATPANNWDPINDGSQPKLDGATANQTVQNATFSVVPP